LEKQTAAEKVPGLVVKANGKKAVLVVTNF
jgi:hypothetical protein